MCRVGSVGVGLSLVVAVLVGNHLATTVHLPRHPYCNRGRLGIGSSTLHPAPQLASLQYQ